MPIASTTTALATTATIQALAKSIVDTFITPKFQKLEKYLKTKGKTHLHDYWVNQFSDYIMTYYEKYSIINTIAFNNQQRMLKELYIPLSVVKDDDDEVIKLLDYTDNFLPFYRKVIITDTAGMGKSTLTKKLFLSVVDQNKGLPILIELRRLNKEKKIIDEIIEQLGTLQENADKDFVFSLIDRGDFIFFFDGFDEIGLDEKNSVTKDMQDFINKANKNLFFITSRPENSLTSFGGFMKFHINPLDKTEAFELLRKYNNYGDLSNLLIEKIEDVILNISEFLTNPLLVSLLYTAFEYKQTIPFKKHIFYRQVYDALFESHDLSKGESFERSKIRKCNKLDREDFHRVLRFVGYECLKISKTEFTKDEIIQLLSKATKFCSDLSFKEGDFLADITISAPLFSIDGIYYKWSHKSLQEYFAAQFIHLDSQDLQAKILEKIAVSNSVELYLNILDLYYSIDPKTFKNVVVYKFLNDYINFYDSESVNFSFDENVVKQRLELTFLQNFLLLYTDSLKVEDHPAYADTVKKIFTLVHEKIKSPSVNYSLISKGYKIDHLEKIFYVLGENKSYEKLIKLLYSKRVFPFLKKIDTDYNPADIILSGVELDTVYTIDSNPSSIFNVGHNFERLNLLILAYTDINVVIDISKARDYIIETNKDIEVSNRLMLDDF